MSTKQDILWDAIQTADQKVRTAQTAKDEAVQAVIDAFRNSFGQQMTLDAVSGLDDADQALAAAIEARKELS